jgi:hypothetical protein
VTVLEIVWSQQATTTLFPGAETMRLISTFTLIAAVCAAGSLAAQEAPGGATRNVPDSLVPKAKINEDSARAVALKRVPGTVQGVALERERKRLMWDFKIQRTGRKGTTEVEVSAMTGRVIAVQTATSAKGRSTTRHSS